MKRLLVIGGLIWAAACQGDPPATGDPETNELPPSAETARPDVLDLWERGIPAFGVFVPDERPVGGSGDRQSDVPLYTEAGGVELGRSPLYDFLFLDLERGYAADAVRRIAAGLRGRETVGRKALLVRIPPLSEAGVEITRERIEEVLRLGADGVVLPHVRSVEEAEQVVSFFEDAGADVWSPGNPAGSKIAMLMLEDPDAVAQAAEIADLPGYSILACGIGSLTSALGGDRQAAEEGTQHVLAEATRAGLPDMITANPETVEQRIAEGFLALLASGPAAERTAEIGRAAVGR